MKTSRRKFLKSSALLSASLLLPAMMFAETVIEKTSKIYNASLKKVVLIMKSLKKEGSNVVTKVMANKEYVFDPYFHYPYDGGIVDKKTGSRVFFHAHRKNEYGHFHTFINDEKGDLVHLVLISMDKEGRPLALATVNRWVTGDKYVKADKLKMLLDDFKIAPELFEDDRLLRFVNNIMTGYKEEIHKLFEKRDEWIRNYAFTYTREPFKDKNHEVLSMKEINVFEDAGEMG